MSKRESRRRQTAAAVMKEAHRLYKRGAMFLYSFSTCLKLAWRSIRGLCKFKHTRAKGVNFNNNDGISRQAILHALTKYSKGQISLYLEVEPDNPYDPSAVKVMAMVRNKGIAQVGYLAKEIAADVSLNLKEGKEVIAIFETITGGASFNYGLNFSYATV